MNDERIQQVLNIEKEARQIHDNAVHESEQILILAGQEVESIIENSKAEAQREARRLVAGAQTKDESTRILAEAEEKSAHAKKMAAGNFERAVRFVLEQTAGKD